MTLKRSQIAIALVLGLVLIGNIVLTHNLFTSPYPGHNDFMSRWEGARSFWLEGLNPYSAEASLNIQERIYGRAALPTEDPGYFAYPFYTAFIIAPLVTMEYAWASAVWMVLLEVCLIGSLFLILDILKWRPTPIMLGVLVLWAVFDYFAMRGLLLGQPGIVVYFLEMMVIWALVRKHDGLAGVALALSTIKPQMGFLFVPLILLFALFYRRWRVMITFGVVMTVLAGGSFLLVPSWLTDWLTQVGSYTSYTAIGSPVWVITQYYLGLGDTGEYLVVAALILLMLWSWFELLFRRRSERLLWTIALTLTITHLAAVRTATTHFVVFTLPILFFLSGLVRRKKGWLAVVIPLAIAAVSWVHFVTTVRGEFEHPSLYLPLPLTVLLLLLIFRRVWWTRG